ncbi:MAG: hypothetical protein F6K55_04580, partial [Moorea sp. SIO4A3]|nr:hypothetical protein [Moorena sp. SIO4A3]
MIVLFSAIIIIFALGILAFVRSSPAKLIATVAYPSSKKQKYLFTSIGNAIDRRSRYAIAFLEGLC